MRYTHVQSRMITHTHTHTRTELLYTANRRGAAGVSYCTHKFGRADLSALQTTEGPCLTWWQALGEKKGPNRVVQKQLLDLDLLKPDKQGRARHRVVFL
jgi:hypothetical protein